MPRYSVLACDYISLGQEIEADTLEEALALAETPSHMDRAVDLVGAPSLIAYLDGQEVYNDTCEAELRSRLAEEKARADRLQYVLDVETGKVVPEGWMAGRSRDDASLFRDHRCALLVIRAEADRGLWSLHADWASVDLGRDLDAGILFDCVAGLPTEMRHAGSEGAKAKATEAASKAAKQIQAWLREHRPEVVDG